MNRNDIGFQLHWHAGRVRIISAAFSPLPEVHFRRRGQSDATDGNSSHPKSTVAITFKDISTTMAEVAKTVARQLPGFKLGQKQIFL
jgi:hypothetical protein